MLLSLPRNSLRSSWVTFRRRSAKSSHCARKAVITGEIKGNEGDKFTAGKLGDYTVGADKTVVLGDPFKFNKNNIDQFKF